MTAAWGGAARSAILWFLAGLLVGACGGDGAPGTPAAGRQPGGEPTGAQAPGAQAPSRSEPGAREPAAGEPGAGFEVRPRGGEARFVAWESEQTVNRVIAELGRAGGTITFAPGTYEIRMGIRLTGVSNVSLLGGGEAQLVFPEHDGRAAPVLTRAASPGDTELWLDHPEQLFAGGSYQLYRPDAGGDRILEFVVAAVQEERVELVDPVRFMSHVHAIPAGSHVLEALNFFLVRGSERVRIEGFEMDGRGRGNVAGHTLYSGVLANGYWQADKSALPVTRGLEVVGNGLRGLRGRGVAVYATDEVRIEGNRLEDVFAEAIEMDHFSRGEVLDNDIRGAGTGIALNDAIGCRVAHNRIRGCTVGVGFVKHFDDPRANAGNVVEDNRIQGPGQRGVSFRPGIDGNTVRRNVIAGLPTPLHLEGTNVVEDNTVED